MFTLTIKTDNSAFDLPWRHEEIARILREIARHMAEDKDDSGLCVDMNGNVVGRFTLTEEAAS